MDPEDGPDESEAIVMQGEAAAHVFALAERAGLDPISALRRALALYAWFLTAREQGQRILVEHEGKLQEPLFHLRDQHGDSKGAL